MLGHWGTRKILEHLRNIQSLDKLVQEFRIFVRTSKPRQTRARLGNVELADETELVSLAVGYRVVDRWKKRILLIYSLKQKQTRKRSDRSCQAKRAVVPKRLIQLLGRCLLLIILRPFLRPHYSQSSGYS